MHREAGRYFASAILPMTYQHGKFFFHSESHVPPPSCSYPDTLDDYNKLENCVLQIQTTWRRRNAHKISFVKDKTRRDKKKENQQNQTQNHNRTAEFEKQSRPEDLFKNPQCCCYDSVDKTENDKQICINAVCGVCFVDKLNNVRCCCCSCCASL